MTIETILKKAYNDYSNGKDCMIIYDNKPEDNNHINQLRDDGVITVKVRTIEYAIVSLTSIGVRHCEELF